MSDTAIILAGCGAEASRTITAEIQKLFPVVVVAAEESVEKALARQPAAGREILVLSDPRKDEFARAAEASDAKGLPRWAILVVGTNPEPARAETLPTSELSGPALRRALNSASARHSLQRELSRARGDLLAIGSRVAHDLRTQVAGILTSTELLREILLEEQPSRAVLTEPILDSVDALGKIIERLTFITKATAAGPSSKPMDMGAAIHRALERMDAEIRKKNAFLLESELWPAVEGNSAWTEKIWLNLISNALAHNNSGVNIEIGWSEENRELKFWIRDNGDGVCPEKRTQLFQPFNLMHRVNSPRGMGLPIVQRLVEMQGGTCGFQPREKGGSDFYFTLPAASRDSADPS